jgi:hypothetical protein
VASQQQEEQEQCVVDVAKFMDNDMESNSIDSETNIQPPTVPPLIVATILQSNDDVVSSCLFSRKTCGLHLVVVVERTVVVV